MEEISQEEVEQAIEVLEQAQDHFDSRGLYEMGTEMSHARATLNVHFTDE